MNKEAGKGAEHSLKKLIKEARESMYYRGHSPSRAATSGKVPELQAQIRCNDCGMQVWVQTKPAPNSIDISGSAIAMHCTGSKS